MRKPEEPAKLAELTVPGALLDATESLPAMLRAPQGDAGRASRSRQRGSKACAALESRRVGAESGSIDPLDLLEEQAAQRDPALVPVRYGRMLASPFAFFRGAAAIMAMDLAKTPDPGDQVQLCGDAHLSNFGVFAAPDRRLVLDVNDFDETLPGPWEWDLKRLAASFAIAGRDRDFTGRRRPAVLSSARAYREAMRETAAMRASTSGMRASTSTPLRATWRRTVAVVERSTA